MSTFLDKFVLAILAALFLLVITNPMHFDVRSQIVAGCLIVGSAFLCARAIQKHPDASRAKSVDPSKAPTELTKNFPTSGVRPRAAMVAENVKQLREGHGVALLRETQSGKTFTEIPSNSFGFMYGHAFVHVYKRMAVTTSEDGCYMYELHKLADGTALLVGYVGPETGDRLLGGLKKGETLTIYSRSSEVAPGLVVVPLDHLKIERSRTLTIAKKQMSALDCEAL